MHRENNERRGLLSYIRGNKKGREAHNLERGAMQDPFLADALDGYSNMEDPELDARLRRMEEKVEQCGLKIFHESVAASGQQQDDMSPRDEFAMRMSEIDNDVASQSKSILSKRRRRNFFIRFSAAACILLVCTISYKIGGLRGEKTSVTVDRANPEASHVYEQALPVPEKAMAEMSFSPNSELQRDSAEPVEDAKKSFLKNINESPRPLNGYKAYYEYIYNEMKELVSFDSANTRGIVVLNFDIDDSGRPSNIEITESSSGTVDQKLIDIIKKGERWSGQGHIESFVFLYAE